MKHKMIQARTVARDQMRGHVASRILPALGLHGQDFELEIPPDGTRSVILFLATAGGRHVLRCLPDFARAAHTALTLKHMNARGAPVPRLVYADMSPWTRFRLGHYILVEEAIEGGSLRDLGKTEERLRPAARALARLHGITRKKWGPLPAFLGRRGSYSRLLQRRLNRRLDDLALESPEFAGCCGEPFRKWFAARPEAGVQPGGFSLCHLRISATNVLFSSSGEATLIDVYTARYAHHAVDLERALYRWCGRDPGRQSVFLDAYFETLTGVPRDFWESIRDYHKASFHVTQVYRAAKEFRGFLQDGRSEKLRGRMHTVVRHLNLLLDVMRASHDAPPGAILAAAERSIRDGETAWTKVVDERCPQPAVEPE